MPSVFDFMKNPPTHLLRRRRRFLCNRCRCCRRGCSGRWRRCRSRRRGCGGRWRRSGSRWRRSGRRIRHRQGRRSRIVFVFSGKRLVRIGINTLAVILVSFFVIPYLIYIHHISFVRRHGLHHLIGGHFGICGIFVRGSRRGLRNHTLKPQRIISWIIPVQFHFNASVGHITINADQNRIFGIVFKFQIGRIGRNGRIQPKRYVCGRDGMMGSIHNL